MRQVVREKRPIKTLEMVPASAYALLKREGHFQRADEIGNDGLVELIQISSFTDLSKGPHLRNTSELGAFKIFSLEFIGGRELKLTGCVYPSKRELKEFLKKLRLYGENNHLKIGLDKRFWFQSREGIVWLKAGLDARKKLIEKLKESLWSNETEEISAPLSMDRLLLYRTLLKRSGKTHIHIGEIVCRSNAESDIEDLEDGLLEAAEEIWVTKISYFQDQQFEEEIISSLQTIDKTLNMLGFKTPFQLLQIRGRSKKKGRALERALEKLGWDAEVGIMNEGPMRLEFLVEDGLGLKRTAAYIEEAGSLRNCFSINVSVEKMFALLLEKYSGVPCWLEKQATNRMGLD